MPRLHGVLCSGSGLLARSDFIYFINDVLHQSHESPLSHGSKQFGIIQAMRVQYSTISGWNTEQFRARLQRDSTDKTTF